MTAAENRQEAAPYESPRYTTAPAGPAGLAGLSAEAPVRPTAPGLARTPIEAVVSHLFAIEMRRICRVRRCRRDRLCCGLRRDGASCPPCLGGMAPDEIASLERVLRGAFEYAGIQPPALDFAAWADDFRGSQKKDGSE